jgi:hypothetical protein
VGIASRSDVSIRISQLAWRLSLMGTKLRDRLPERTTKRILLQSTIDEETFQR